MARVIRVEAVALLCCRFFIVTEPFRRPAGIFRAGGSDSYKEAEHERYNI